MPFANVDCVVSFFLQKFCQSDLGTGQAKACDINSGIAHAHTNWQPARGKGHAGGCTGGLSIHARHAHALIREFIDVGGRNTAHCVQFWNPHVPKTNVVDQNVQKVWWLSFIILTELLKQLIHGRVVLSPLLCVLGLQDVVLCILNNRIVIGESRGAHRESCGCR